MNKKKLISMAALLGVLFLLIIVYFAVTNLNKPEESDGSQAETYYISNRDSSDITSLSYSLNGGDTLEFKLSGGTWIYDIDHKFPLDPTAVTKMAEYIATVTSTRLVEGGELSEFGLTEPTVKIKVGFKDGSFAEYTVGGKNAYNGTYYLMTDHDGKIYTVASSIYTTFNYTLDDMLKVDSVITDVNDGYINSFTVKTNEGLENTVTDEEKLNELYTLFQKLNFTAPVDYYADEASMLDDYGISKDGGGLTISYKQLRQTNETSSSIRVDVTYTVLFGKLFSETDENGTVSEYVYYTPSTSSIVYRMPISLYNSITAYLN